MKQNVKKAGLKGKNNRWRSDQVTGKNSVTDLADKKEPGELLEHRPTQDLSRERSEFSIALLENAPNPILVINPDSSIRYVSPAFESLTGFSSEELIGRKSPYPWWPEEKVREYEYAGIEGKKKGINKLELCHRKKNGELFWVEAKIKPIIDVEELKYLLWYWVDITERKRAEEALRASEQLHRNLVEATGDVVWEVDRQATYTFISPQISGILGYKPEELLGQKPFFTMPPDEVERVSKIYRESAVEKKPFKKFECLNRHKNGQTVIMETSGTPFYDSSGDFLGFRGIGHDITEQKRAEEALRDSDAFNNALLENAPNPVFATNLDTSIRYVNPALETLTGFNSAELIGQKAPYPWYQAEKLQQYNSEDSEARKKGFDSSDFNSFERCHRKKNGELFWVVTNIKAIRDKGEIKYFLANWADITARKRAEEALKESVAHFRLLTQKSPVPIIINDDKGKIEYVNDRFIATFGYSLEDFPDIEAWWRLAYPDERYRQTVRSTWHEARESAKRENKEMEPQEYQLTCKDGSVRVVEVSSTGIGNKQVVAFNDISGRRKAEEDLKRSFEKIQKALQSSINATAKMVEMRDPFTSGHQQRVAKLSMAIAKELNLTDEQIKYIGMAAVVHDIGKINIPAEILTRTGKLTQLESRMIKTHVQGSYDILKDIEFPWPIAEIVMQHHERLDGSGYPHGLRGVNILPEAKILAVADTVEAMSSHRPYRPALGTSKASDEISQNRGILYDAEVVDAYLRLVERGFKF